MMIGIIGYGSFGKLMAKHLSVYDKILVYDAAKNVSEKNIRSVSLDEITKCPIIIFAVPMKHLKDALEAVSGKVQRGTLVLDVCSLKIFSCELMDSILPSGVDIVGTHPLFGPQSCPISIEGRKIALCNVRGKRLSEVKKFCEEKLKLQTYTVTPDEHDKQMAYSQALTHFIGRVSVMMKVRDVKLGTKTYDDFLDIANIIKNDDWELFESIETMNPYALHVRQEFLENARKLDAQLSKKKK